MSNQLTGKAIVSKQLQSLERLQCLISSSHWKGCSVKSAPVTGKAAVSNPLTGKAAVSNQLQSLERLQCLISSSHCKATVSNQLQ